MTDTHLSSVLQHTGMKKSTALSSGMMEKKSLKRGLRNSV